MRFSCPAAFILFFLSPAAAEDLKAALDRLAAPLREEKPAAGFVVGVWADGRATVAGYGKVTTPSGAADPDGDTLFEIGSVTKAFTGVLLAEAVARREVALDDPVNKHLPPELRIKIENGGPITLLHLATHRSGLPVQPPLIGLFARDPANPYADYTRPKLAKLMEVVKPQREPGKEYGYSNLGVGLLGHALVAAARAESFDALVRGRIAAPLGLKDTAEALTGAQKARLGRGHTAKIEPAAPWDFAALEACGSLKSTANDLLRFAAANLGDAKTPLFEAMKASHEKREAAVGAVAIGLCWHRSGLKAGGPAIWHNGGTGGYRAMLAFAPESRTAAVVLCAADVGHRADALALGVLEFLQAK